MHNQKTDYYSFFSYFFVWISGGHALGTCLLQSVQHATLRQSPSVQEPGLRCVALHVLEHGGMWNSSCLRYPQDLKIAWADTEGLSNPDLANHVNTLRAAGGSDSTWPDMMTVIFEGMFVANDISHFLIISRRHVTLLSFWIHSIRYLVWNFRTAIIYICFVLQRFFHSMRLYSCRLKRWCICTGALHNVLLVLQILPSLAVSVMDLVSVGAAGLEPTVPSNVVVVPRIHAGAGFCKWWFECHSLQLEVPSPSFKLFLIFSWGSGHGLCEEDGSCTCEGGWVGQVINCTAINIWSWGQLESK